MMRLLFALVLLLSAPLALAQTPVRIVHVAPWGLGTGASWATAYGSLDAALGNAQPGDVIVLASGSYVPGGTDRTATFEIGPEVAGVYGGWIGNETLTPGTFADALDARFIEGNQATLSGDLVRDDTPGTIRVGKDDNAFHVVTIGARTAPLVLDGVTIVGGFADQRFVTGRTPTRSGGGLYALASSGALDLTLRHVRFDQNYGSYGADLFVEAQSPARLLRLTLEEVTGRNPFDVTSVWVEVQTVQSVIRVRESNWTSSADEPLADFLYVNHQGDHGAATTDSVSVVGVTAELGLNVFSSGFGFSTYGARPLLDVAEPMYESRWAARGKRRFAHAMCSSIVRWPAGSSSFNVRTTCAGNCRPISTA